MQSKDPSRIYIHEDLTKIENRVNVALFGMMAQDWFREWFLERLVLPKDSILYPPTYTKRFRPDLTVQTPYGTTTLAWIEVELDKNEDQIKKYREIYSEPVKTVWGRRSSGGDLSLEEIQDYLSDQMSSLSPQIKTNVKYLIKLIKHGLDRRYKLINEEKEFLESFENPDAQDAARQLLAVAEDVGATRQFLGNGVIIRAKCSLIWGRRVSVAWIYPLGKPGQSNLKGLKDFSFGARKNTLSDTRYPKLQMILEQWIEEWRNSKDFQAEYVTNTDYTAYSVNPNDAVNYIGFLEDRLKRVISHISSL